MKKFFAGALVAAALVGGSLVAVAPAQALTPSDVASSATTTVTGDCHAGASVTRKILFPDDTYTVTLTNCNSNWTPNASTWKYGNIWTNVTRGNGGTGVRAPDAYIVTDDQQCIQQNSSNNFVSIPQNLGGFTTQMTDAITSAITINAYDHDNGQCTTTGNVYRFNQVAYQLSPITPTITAAFGSPSVGVSTDTNLTVTLTNTQRYRAGVRGTFTGVGFDIALPAGATLNTGSASGTCVGSVSQVSTTFSFTGASINNLTDSCTVIVPISFASTGNVALNGASLTASSSNKGALINDLSASITVNNGESISPATQAPTMTVGEAMTPTTAFTPTGFTGTVTYSILPVLPDGLSFDTATGVISGTPTAAQASADYTVTATDGSRTATATISLGISSPPVILSPEKQTIEANVGESVSTAALDTTTMPCAADMTISPALPAGLEFDPVTGVISGTPTEIAVSENYVISFDCGGGNPYTSIVTLSVGSAATPDIAGLVNTGLALLGPAGVIALLLAIGAPFFFVSERFRKIRTVGALVFHKSSHVTITSPATFFDRLRGKKK